MMMTKRRRVLRTMPRTEPMRIEMPLVRRMMAMMMPMRVVRARSDGQFLDRT